MNNPWIENTTGVAPNIPYNTPIDYMLRGEDEGRFRYIDGEHCLGNLNWSLEYGDYDIVKWKYAREEDIPKGRKIDITEAIQICKDAGWADMPDEPIRAKRAEPQGKIKSDGGSTDYYKLTIKTKDGAFDCELGDVIRSAFGNDFDLGNAVKAIRRIYCESQGFGKEGIDMRYDANKVKWFIEQFVENNE